MSPELPQQPPSDPRRSVRITRRDTGRYTAVSASGATLDFGTGEGEFTPVELLLAAIAGCSAIDVDVVTSRRSTPEKFEVEVGAERIVEDGAVRLEDVLALFDVRFPDDESGRLAQSLVPRLVKASHDKDCTVSRTVEHPTRVDFQEISQNVC